MEKIYVVHWGSASSDDDGNAKAFCGVHGIYSTLAGAKIALKDCKDQTYDDIVNNTDIIKRWGTGWKAEEYRELEEKYQEWMDHYEHDTLAQQKLFRELSELEVQKSKARQEGDKNAYKNLSELVSKKMSDANIKPAQKKILGEEDGEILGVMIREIENNEPISECLPQFKDVDGIESLIVRTFLKPFARVYGLASGEEEIELSDEMKESLEKSKKVDKYDEKNCHERSYGVLPFLRKRKHLGRLAY